MGANLNPGGGNPLDIQAYINAMKGIQSPGMQQMPGLMQTQPAPMGTTMIPSSLSGMAGSFGNDRSALPDSAIGGGNNVVSSAAPAQLPSGIMRPPSIPGGTSYTPMPGGNSMSGGQTSAMRPQPRNDNQTMNSVGNPNVPLGGFFKGNTAMVGGGGAPFAPNPMLMARLNAVKGMQNNILNRYGGMIRGYQPNPGLPFQQNPSM